MAHDFLTSRLLSAKARPDRLAWPELLPGLGWSSRRDHVLDRALLNDRMEGNLPVAPRDDDALLGKPIYTDDVGPAAETISSDSDWGGAVETGSELRVGHGTLAFGGTSGVPDGSGAAAVAAPMLPANRILVQWQQGSSASQRRSALRGLQGAGLGGTIESRLMERFGQGPLEVITLPTGASAEQALAAYRGRRGVAMAEVDWVVGTQAVSNDPYYTTSSRLWGMYSSDSPAAAGGSGTTNRFGSQAEQAWAQGYTGSSATVVGVIDEGIDYTHPDLYLNIWLNQGEIRGLSFFGQLVDVNGDGLITFRDLNDPGNRSFVSDVNLNGRIDAGDLLRDGRWADGRDSDGNGYRDDLVGWDFYNNSNDPFRASDGDNHGTHVAGTIGGIGGNGIGVA